MADGKSGLSGGRIVLSMVGATLGLLAFGAGGCDEGVCSCPPTTSAAFLHLECLPIVPPMVTTTGPCFFSTIGQQEVNPNGPDAAAVGSQDIALSGSGAGTCHVALTFGNGATSSVDVEFKSVSYACGSDPNGCGQGFSGPTTMVSVPEPACEGALDAGASD